eukprot:scaffold54763_cov54-Phaeocystis_antarctica.AAC.2
MTTFAVLVPVPAPVSQGMPRLHPSPSTRTRPSPLSTTGARMSSSIGRLHPDSDTDDVCVATVKY